MSLAESLNANLGSEPVIQEHVGGLVEFAAVRTPAASPDAGPGFLHSTSAMASRGSCSTSTAARSHLMCNQ